MNLENTQKGIAIYLAIVVMFILLSIGVGLSTILVGQIRTIAGIGDSVVAFYAADTGIEEELALDRAPGTYSDYIDLNGDGSQDLDEPTYQVTVIDSGGGCVTGKTIQSIGIYKGVRRAIEITKGDISGTGPPMDPNDAAVLTTFTGFETGGFEEAVRTTVGSTIVQDPVHSGSYALELGNPPSHDQVEIEVGNSAGNDHIVGFAVQFSQTTSNNTAVIFQPGEFTPPNGPWFSHITLLLETNGDLTVGDKSGLTWTAPDPFDPAQWYFVELYWQNTNTGNFSLSVDGNILLAGSGDFLYDVDPFSRHRFKNNYSRSEKFVYFDDFYHFSGVEGTLSASDFLCNAEVFAYQSGNTSNQDQGAALDSGTWDNVGQTPVNDTQETLYDVNVDASGDAKGSTITNTGPRNGPVGDSQILGDNNIKGAKWIHRRKSPSGGAGRTDVNLIGNNVDGVRTIDIDATITAGYENFFYVSEDDTEVPMSDEYFQHGFGKLGSGGRDTLAAEIWAMILHVP